MTVERRTQTAVASRKSLIYSTTRYNAVGIDAHMEDASACTYRYRLHEMLLRGVMLNLLVWGGVGRRRQERRVGSGYWKLADCAHRSHFYDILTGCGEEMKVAPTMRSGDIQLQITFYCSGCEDARVKEKHLGGNDCNQRKSSNKQAKRANHQCEKHREGLSSLENDTLNPRC